MDDVAVVCTGCGVPRDVGNRFCQNCGQPVNPDAFACTSCGAQVNVSTQPTVDPMQKSRIAAGLLGIFLGSLGVHNFYLGNTGKAVAQLLISLLSLGYLSGISAIWGLIEGIMILTGSIAVDGKGLPLRD